MKTFIFDLTTSWDGVLDYFEEVYGTRNEDVDYYDFDVFKTAVCWLSHRVYHKTGGVCLSTMELALPFDMEIAIFHDYQTLIDNDYRLGEFEDYLTFIDLEQYKLSSNIDIKVFYRTLAITKL